MRKFVEGLLFPDLEPDINEVRERYRLEYETSKRRVNNLHLLSYPDFEVEGDEQMPVVQSYTGLMPQDLVSFSHRRDLSVDASVCAVHGFEYDNRIVSTWTRPLDSVSGIKRFGCAVAPDFSVLVDQPKAVNVTNIYRNRWVSCFWTSRGVRVIPSASWGCVESFSWCFDGLPAGGVIAVGHVVEGRDRAQRRLYRMGVEELIARKRPDVLLVYGAPLGFDPGVEVVLYDGEIQKMRRYGKAE